MLIKGKTQLLFGNMGRLSENSVVNIKNKSHAVTAEIVVPDGGAQGVIIAQGGNIGGWSLYVKDGKLRYCYNLLGITYSYVESRDALPAGDHQVRMEFAYEGGGPGKGGVVSLFVDGKEVGTGRVPDDGGHGLLGRRRMRRRARLGLTGLAGVRRARQRVHRSREGSGDRHRGSGGDRGSHRRRRGGGARRHGAAVGTPTANDTATRDTRRRAG